MEVKRAGIRESLCFFIKNVPYLSKYAITLYFSYGECKQIAFHNVDEGGKWSNTNAIIVAWCCQ